MIQSDSNFTDYELTLFEIKRKRLQEDYQQIDDSESVKEALIACLSVISDDYSIVPYQMRDGDDESLFLFLDGGLVALAEIAPYKDKKVLALTFHVNCLANTAIKLNSSVSTLVDIPVVSSDVFYAETLKGTDGTKLYFNKKAVAAFALSKYDSLREKVEEDIARERAEKELKVNKILH